MANRKPAVTPRKRKPAKPPAPRARATEPAPDVGQTGAGWREAQLEAAYWSFGLLSDYRDQVYVNDYTAQTYSVVWRCISYISQTIAGLGWDQLEGVPGKAGKEPVYDDVSWLLDMQASPEMSAFEWRQVMIRDALCGGNGYSEIDRDGFSRPRWLWYICPDRVSLKRDNAGSLYYAVDNGIGQEPTILPPDRMFHLRGPGPDGLIGYSVIALARKSIRLGLQMEQYGDTYFRRGPMPGGILEMPGSPKKEERDAMRESFQKTYGGSKNAGRVVVITGGGKFNPLSLPNDDAQFIESRKFEIGEICRWFGIPPHKVFDLERATFSNIEQQSIEVVQDCLLPWCRRLETEADIKLFGRVMRGRRWTRLNLNALLRGDSATQTDNLVKQVTAGITKIDEARDHLDMNPLQDKLGDTPLIQGAMAPLERVINPPEPVAPQPAPKPAQDGAAPAQGGDTPAQQPDQTAQARAIPAQVAETFSTLLADTYAWQLRVETDKATRANNKEQLGNHVAGYYTPDWERTLAAKVRPVLAAMLLALGRPAEDAANLAENFACDHATRSVRDLTAGSWLADWSNGRAGEQARDHVAEVWEAIGR